MQRRKVNKVHERIRQDIRGCYDGFLKALTKSDQEHIAELLREVGQLQITQIHEMDMPTKSRLAREVKIVTNISDEVWNKDVLTCGHVAISDPDKIIDLDTRFIERYGIIDKGV